MLNKFLPIIIIFFIMSFCPFVQRVKNVEIPKTDKEEFIKQIKTVDCDNEDRLKSLEELLESERITESEFEIKEFENDVINLELTVKGNSSETIVVGAHYDKTTRGCGAIDNWTGIVMIVNLYKNFKSMDNQKTYKFVAFGKEEKGLHGSKAFVKEIPNSKRNNYCAMVNFDSFGFTDLWALESISDKSLINLAGNIANEIGQTFEVKNYKKASSDSESFQDANIPAITLSGLGDNWREYLHQDKDQLENIDFDKVFENLKFSYEYLKQIDTKPCGSFR